MKVMGSNIKLTDSIREHAEDKVGNAVRNYNAMVSHVDINLSVKTKGRGQKGADEHKAEVTVYTRRHGLIRAEERSANDGSVYESIDLVSDKLARKLRRTKEKTNNRVRHGREVHRQDRDEKLEEQMEEEIEIEIESKRAEMIERAQNTDSVVIRVKEFEMPPMTVRWPGARRPAARPRPARTADATGRRRRAQVSDAVEAVENIDHDWYVFCNSETGKINVLYARNAGGYGLVVPLMDGEEGETIGDGKRSR